MAFGWWRLVELESDFEATTHQNQFLEVGPRCQPSQTSDLVVFESAQSVWVGESIWGRLDKPTYNIINQHISKIPNNFLDSLVRVLYIAEPRKLSDICYNLQPMVVLELKYGGVHKLDSSTASTKILSIHLFMAGLKLK